MTDRKFTPPTKFPAEYVNGQGDKITILGRSDHDLHPLIGYGNYGLPGSWTEDGRHPARIDGRFLDLYDIPKRIVRWHNFYLDLTNGGYCSRQKADKASYLGRICVFRIECNQDGTYPYIFREDV